MTDRPDPQARAIQRPAAEQRYARELEQLAAQDADRPKPAGWRMTPGAVTRFILGDEAQGLAAKFVGSRRLIERCVVALATQRGLMLIGEPGTAKSTLSELLAAAISGDSTLTVQGSAGVTEDDLKYSWNYALLLAQGPSPAALVPAPLHRGMAQGKLVRVEEITRCPLEIQDSLLSILSERVMVIPELKEDQARTLFAVEGFGVIATANTRDRGVHQMSAALKRRFNVETVPPIDDLRQERDLVMTQVTHQLEQAQIPLRPSQDLTELLVTTFHELRRAQTLTGAALEPLTTLMSTAEAVGVALAATTHAYYFGDAQVQPTHVLDHLVGSTLKEDAQDLKRLERYFEQVVKARPGSLWRAYYEASRRLLP